MSLSIVIMAAGKGTRMKSAHPKVLHRLAGRPLLEHVLQAARALQAHRIIVITGHGAEAVEAHVARAEPQATCVRQMPQHGTGHAVQQAVPRLPDDGTVLVLNGDVPLIGVDTARSLVQTSGGTRLALLTIELPDPSGYGRILRDAHGTIQGIVEHKDANQDQRAIREVYTGVMAAPAAWLKQAVMALNNENSQGEYYLTDVVAMAVSQGMAVASSPAPSEDEVLGVNSPAQLADLERRHQRAQASALLEAGVRLADPSRLDVRGRLQCGQDVEIDINCIFEGDVSLGDGVRIGSHCVIRQAHIAASTVIQPFTHIDGGDQPVTIGEGAQIGPFARLRPGASLGRDVHIGNFVEVKNSSLADGAKANPLAYLGDATVGPRVNYGAGSITANYDGANKHRTVIGADAHIGSNCVLVAPVTIGEGATIGGGSVISRDAPAGQLTVARARQASLSGWTRPTKNKR